MQPVHKFVSLSSINLSYYEWGPADGPVILLVHCTGMCARVWDKTIEHFPEHYRVIATDTRGHGASEYDGYMLDWSLMGNDIKDFIEVLDLNDFIGVGHSMGGHVMAQAAISMPERFKRMVLIDPVMFSPERYKSTSFFEDGDPKDNPLARRRNQFKNWQDMYDKYKDREPYSHWVPETLENYCRYGTKQTEENGPYSLCCHPATEASVYMGHHSVELTEFLPDVKVPTDVLRAVNRPRDPNGPIDFAASPTWPELASVFGNAKDHYLPEYTHFIPMEAPELTAKHILGEAG